MSLGVQYVFSEERYLADLCREDQHTGNGQLSNCAPFALASKSALASFFGSQQAVDRLWILGTGGCDRYSRRQDTAHWPGVRKIKATMEKEGY
jgi:hypothetical protein